MFAAGVRRWHGRAFAHARHFQATCVFRRRHRMAGHQASCQRLAKKNQRQSDDNEM